MGWLIGCSVEASSSDECSIPTEVWWWCCRGRRSRESCPPYSWLCALLLHSRHDDMRCRYAYGRARCCFCWCYCCCWRHAEPAMRSTLTAAVGMWFFNELLHGPMVYTTHGESHSNCFCTTHAYPKYLSLTLTTCTGPSRQLCSHQHRRGTKRYTSRQAAAAACSHRSLIYLSSAYLSYVQLAVCEPHRHRRCRFKWSPSGVCVDGWNN